jgi:hypothetical protein
VPMANPKVRLPRSWETEPTKLQVKHGEA